MGRGKEPAQHSQAGVDFNDVPEMFRHPMLALQDERFDYEEARWISMGWINAWVSVVAYTERQGEVIRIISARRATRREVMRYVETVQTP